MSTNSTSASDSLRLGAEAETSPLPTPAQEREALALLREVLAGRGVGVIRLRGSGVRFALRDETEQRARTV